MTINSRQFLQIMIYKLNYSFFNYFRNEQLINSESLKHKDDVQNYLRSPRQIFELPADFRSNFQKCFLDKIKLAFSVKFSSNSTTSNSMTSKRQQEFLKIYLAREAVVVKNIYQIKRNKFYGPWKNKKN